MLERLILERGQTAAVAAAPPVNPDEAEERFMKRFERFSALFDRMRPAQESASPMVSVTTLPSGDTLVANKDGIDKDITGLFMAKGMISDAAKAIGDRIAKAKVASAAPSGGNVTAAAASAGQPPRPPVGR